MTFISYSSLDARQGGLLVFDTCLKLTRVDAPTLGVSLLDLEVMVRNASKALLTSQLYHGIRSERKFAVALAHCEILVGALQTCTSAAVAYAWLQ